MSTPRIPHDGVAEVQRRVVWLGGSGDNRDVVGIVGPTHVNRAVANLDDVASPGRVTYFRPHDERLVLCVSRRCCSSKPRPLDTEEALPLAAAHIVAVVNAHSCDRAGNIAACCVEELYGVAAPQHLLHNANDHPTGRAPQRPK